MQDNTNFANQHYSISSNRSPRGHEKIESTTVCCKSTTKDSDIFGIFFQHQKKNIILLRSWRFSKANGCWK